MREKLIVLVGQVQDCGCDVTEVVEMNYVENITLVDHLIANGVEIPVRCKDCKHYKTRSQSAKWKPKAPCCTRAANIFTKPDDFCSYGERRSE